MRVRREPKAAEFVILEVAQQGIGQCACPVGIFIAPFALQLREQGIQQEGVIVEKPGDGAATFRGEGAKATLAPGASAQRGERVTRSGDSNRRVAGTRPRVPTRLQQCIGAGEALVVACRRDAPCTMLAQGFAFAGKGPARIECGATLQVPGPAFEVGRGIQAMGGAEIRGCGSRRRRRDLLARPDVVAAFLAFGVGIERAGVATTVQGHVALQPRHDAVGGGEELSSPLRAAASA